VSLYAATNGYLDPVPVEDVPRFEAELLDWFRGRHAALLESIKTTGDIQDIEAFEAALKGFGEQFEATGGADEPAPAHVVAADAVLADPDDTEAAAE
jgi:F-type H+/Na+-transporting ATPase subunit alpha